MLRKIAVSDLTLGMYIHEFCRPRINDPFWAANVERELSDAAVLRHIQASTREVWIDTRLGKNSVENSPAEQTPPECFDAAETAPCSLELELARARLI